MDALLYFADDVIISGYNLSPSFSSIYTSLIPVSCHKSTLAGLGLCRIHLGKLWSKKGSGLQTCRCKAREGSCSCPQIILRMRRSLRSVYSSQLSCRITGHPIPREMIRSRILKKYSPSSEKELGEHAGFLAACRAGRLILETASSQPASFLMWFPAHSLQSVTDVPSISQPALGWSLTWLLQRLQIGKPDHSVCVCVGVQGAFHLMRGSYS